MMNKSMSKPLFNLTPLKDLSGKLDHLIANRLWLKVLIGLACGLITGFVIGPDLELLQPQTSALLAAWLALPGQVFLALIQMIVVPLVLSSVVRGLASNDDIQSIKSIGLYAIIFILLTTALATSAGIGVSLLINPGHYVDTQLLSSLAGDVVPVQLADAPGMANMPDKLLALIPRNPLSSMVSGEMLQVILFSAILGFALVSMPKPQAQPLFDLLGALQEVCIRVVSWAMKLAPVAVFGLTAKLVASLGVQIIGGMAVYLLCVVIGLGLIFCFYLLVLRGFIGIPLRSFLAHVKEVLLLAFSTSSSAAVMPLTLQVTETELKVRQDIARFLIPLGATINMTGTALYQGAATVFLSQVFNVELTLTSYLFVVTMAVFASIGSPATPGAGIVILSVVLQGVGIPAVGIALLLGVDRILDMCRTSVNVLGDIVTCLLVQRILAKDKTLQEQETPAV